MIHLRHGDLLIGTNARDEAADAYRRALRLRGGSFVRGNWWIAGPYPGGLDDVTQADSQQDVARPIVPAAHGKPAVRWKLLDDTDADLSLHPYFDNAENVTGYAQLFIYSESEQQISLTLGCDDCLRLSLNGEKLFKSRNFVTPGAGHASATLKAGWNRLSAKLVNRTRHHVLQVEITPRP